MTPIVPRNVAQTIATVAAIKILGTSSIWPLKKKGNSVYCTKDTTTNYSWTSSRQFIVERFQVCVKKPGKYVPHPKLLGAQSPPDTPGPEKGHLVRWLGKYSLDPSTFNSRKIITTGSPSLNNKKQTSSYIYTPKFEEVRNFQSRKSRQNSA